MAAGCFHLVIKEAVWGWTCLWVLQGPPQQTRICLDSGGWGDAEILTQPPNPSYLLC